MIETAPRDVHGASFELNDLELSGPHRRKRITVLIVEDHELMIEGLTALLNESPQLEVVGTAGTVKGAIEAATRLDPDVVLMDFRLPDGNGAEATSRICAEHPDVAVLFLSADVSYDAMVRALDAGACGYVSKAASADDLIAAVTRAAEGEFVLPNGTMARLLRRRLANEGDATPAALPELSEADATVLEMIARGLDNVEIAQRLSIGSGRLRRWVRTLLAKLGAESRSEAVDIARSRGLVDDA